VRALDLCWTEWSGEGCYSLLDLGTSQTHLINELPATILRKLAQCPLGLEELTARLAHECGMPEDAVWRGAVERSVDGLIALDLIERQPLARRVQMPAFKELTRR